MARFVVEGTLVIPIRTEVYADSLDEARQKLATEARRDLFRMLASVKEIGTPRVGVEKRSARNEDW